ncbi:MAG: glycine cleavage system protein GcvH [Promethearchaeota archaeon]
MKVNDYEISEGFYYTKTHEWVKVEGSNVRVGLTDYAQKQLRDIVYVEYIDAEDNTVEAGSQVVPASQFASVESVKATSEVYAPVKGEVVEVNDALEDSPELINSDTYGQGWLVIIRAGDLDKQLSKLMTPEQYAGFLKEEVKREQE